MQARITRAAAGGRADGATIIDGFITCPLQGGIRAYCMRLDLLPWNISVEHGSSIFTLISES
jgi:hypothetical protein